MLAMFTSFAQKFNLKIALIKQNNFENLTEAQKAFIEDTLITKNPKYPNFLKIISKEQNLKDAYKKVKTKRKEPILFEDIKKNTVFKLNADIPSIYLKTNNKEFGIEFLNTLVAIAQEKEIQSRYRFYADSIDYYYEKITILGFQNYFANKAFKVSISDSMATFIQAKHINVKSLENQLGVVLRQYLQTQQTALLIKYNKLAGIETDINAEYPLPEYKIDVKVDSTLQNSENIAAEINSFEDNKACLKILVSSQSKENDYLKLNARIMYLQTERMKLVPQFNKVEIVPGIK